VMALSNGDAAAARTDCFIKVRRVDWLESFIAALGILAVCTAAAKADN
jgi:hypothetical protein